MIEFGNSSKRVESRMTLLCVIFGLIYFLLGIMYLYRSSSQQ